MQIGLEEIITLRKADRKKLRTRTVLSIVVLLVLFWAFLCTRTVEIGLISPVQALSNVFTYVKLSLAQIFHWSIFDDQLAVIQAQPYYYETVTRLEGAVQAVVLGAVLAVSGAVYQCVFRNPIATPTMLGVSSGVRLSNFVLVLQYSTIASTATLVTLRYIYGYVFSIGILVVVLVVAHFMGNKKSSVADVLLVGSIVSRLLSQGLRVVQSYVMDDDAYLVLQQMNLYGTDANLGNSQGAIFRLCALLVGMLPLYFMRFSLNVVSFEDEDAKCLGISASRIRTASLIFSTILMVAAQVQLGDVALLALLVPHICRYVFGANFQDMLVGCILYGGIIMLVCKVVVALLSFSPYLGVMSMNVIINVISMPLLIFVLLKERRGWA
ncbi:MAG: iron ABC transporter permease [Oscillospiraceae bacterium]|nr:iron ABC transporter permease [Oscillospiraceae bacterium]